MKESAVARLFPEGGEVRALAMQDAQFAAAYPWRHVEEIVIRIRADFAAGARPKVGERRNNRVRDHYRRECRAFRAMKDGE
jgi:hypothetical protein